MLKGRNSLYKTPFYFFFKHLIYTVIWNYPKYQLNLILFIIIISPLVSFLICTLYTLNISPLLTVWKRKGGEVSIYVVCLEYDAVKDK